MKTTIVSAGLLAIGIQTAVAADMKITGTSYDVTDISIKGEIVRGDGPKFEKIAAQVRTKNGAIVFLDSPGGILGDGLSIGATVNQLRFATAVSRGVTCASVCGMIWLAGATRYLTRTSYIGFHAASDASGGTAGSGNAIAGAYLNLLGFDIDAIAYFTDKEGNDISWLTADDAVKYKIKYVDVDDLPKETDNTPKAFGKKAGPSGPTPAPPQKEVTANWVPSVALTCTLNASDSLIYVAGEFNTQTGAITSLKIVHGLADGRRFDRSQQYNDLKVWQEPAGHFSYWWHGTLKTNANTSMTGHLWLDLDSVWKYSENSFVSGKATVNLVSSCGQ